MVGKYPGSNGGFSPSEVVQLLREKLTIQSGRHLYAVLGTFDQIEAYKAEAAAGAADFASPRNLTYDLLGMMDEPTFSELLQKEATRPLAVRAQLNELLVKYLADSLAAGLLLTLEGLELLFTYELEFSPIRIAATNNRHLLLLVPGQRRNGGVNVYHTGDERFRRSLPANLIADDHLWELK